MYDKVLYGVAGAAGAGVVAWKTMFPWLGYDLQVMKIGKHLKSVMEEDIKAGLILIDKFEENVATQPKKAFIIFEDNIYTYEYVNEQANKVANIVKSWGLTVGDTVAIMIYNEPAFIWTFLGLQKLGVAAALINFNLKQVQLSHSVNVSDAKAFIVGAGEELFNVVLEEEGKFGSMPIYFQGCSGSDVPTGYHSFDDLMSKSSSAGLSPSVRNGVTLNTTGCYIYTSGTTGLPKPVYIPQRKLLGISIALQVIKVTANDIVYTPLPMFHTAGLGIGLIGIIMRGLPKPVFINHSKMMGIGRGFLLMDYNHEDVLYMVMPLYHSAGGGLGLWGTIRTGATMVLRRKFSASHFWEDCCRYNVTVIQYIGELFRYLLSRPKSVAEKQHCIRAAFGNGLRRDIWTQVTERFNIPLMAEFFGATEGTTMLFNISGRPGAVGRLSPLLKKLSPVLTTLVKYDFVTAEPLRDKNGRCIETKPGEKGLLLSQIPQEMLDAGTQFYKSSKAANEKKIVRNALKDGDMFFNFGDILYLDQDYFVYFSDRIGDTFRWKGENVSTTEVANILASLEFIHDANVYGVTVPGHDGRAGMVALTLHHDNPLTEEFLKKMWHHCEDKLVSYARPLFIRLLKEAKQTSTFKQQKMDLVREGFDPSKVQDPLFYADPKTHTYIPISDSVYARIVTSSKL